MKSSGRVGFCEGEPGGDGEEGAATVSDMVEDLNPWRSPDQTLCRNCPYEPAPIPGLPRLGPGGDLRPALDAGQARAAELPAGGPAPVIWRTPLFFSQPFTPIFKLLAQASYGDKWPL